MRISKLAVMAVAAAPVAAFVVPNRYGATSRSSPRLEVAKEITDITALDLPLLIAPVAAFVAGSLALKQKERLESEVAVTEEKLEQIQQQIKSSDFQINTSFGLSLASAALIVNSVFGGLPVFEPPLPSSMVALEKVKGKVSSSPQTPVGLAKVVQKRQEKLSTIPPAPVATVPGSKAPSFDLLLQKVLSTPESTMSADSLMPKLESANEKVVEKQTAPAPESKAPFLESAVQKILPTPGPETAVDSSSKQFEIESENSVDLLTKKLETEGIKVESKLEEMVEGESKERVATQEAEAAKKKAAEEKAAQEAEAVKKKAAEEKAAKEAEAAKKKDAEEKAAAKKNGEEEKAAQEAEAAKKKVEQEKVEMKTEAALEEKKATGGKAIVQSSPTVNAKVPELSAPAFSLSKLANLDPVVLLGAGVLAAGATVAIGTVSKAEEGVATMDPGKKAVGSTYLDGLKSSSATPAKRQGTPASYADTLKAADTSTRSQTTPAPKADTFFSSKVETAPTAAVRPKQAEATQQTRTETAQVGPGVSYLDSMSGASPRPEAQTGFQPTTFKSPPSSGSYDYLDSIVDAASSSKAETVPTTQATPKQVEATQNFDSGNAQAGPGLSYLERMSGASASPQAKTGFQPKTFKSPPSSGSYLDSMVDAGPSSKAETATAAVRPKQAEATQQVYMKNTQAGPGVSYLDSMAGASASPKAKTGFQPKTFKSPPSSGSYLDSIVDAVPTLKTDMAPTTKVTPRQADATQQVKMENSQDGPGLSYLERMSGATSSPQAKTGFQPKTFKSPPSSGSYLDSIVDAVPPSKAEISPTTEVTPRRAEATQQVNMENTQAGLGVSYLDSMAGASASPKAKTGFQPKPFKSPPSSGSYNYLDSIADSKPKTFKGESSGSSYLDSIAERSANDNRR